MLRIQCPSCDSQFKVGEEFLGKYVECGSCEHQFTVAETHVVNMQKKNHYPVKKRQDLSGFTKSFEHAGGESNPTNNHEKHLSKLKQDDFMPAPLWKKAVNLLGWGLFVGGAILLALGSLKNGFLLDAGYDKRFIIAGFIALIASICFIISARYFKNAIPKILLSILVMGALAYFLPKYESPESSGPLKSYPTDKAGAAIGEKDVIQGGQTSITKLKEVCRYQPVQKAIDKSKAGGDLEAESIVALWIMGDIAEHQYAIQDYFKNALNLGNRPSYYPRNGGALILVEQMKGYTLQEVAQIAEVFGEMNDFYIDERLISFTYDPSLFKKLDDAYIVALSDRSASDYYLSNIRELRHFDSNRVLASIQRLTSAEPRYIADVVGAIKLVFQRFRDPKIIDQASVCLLNWYRDDLPKEKAFLNKVARFEERGDLPENWPKSFISVLLASGSTEAQELVLKMWLNDPIIFEPTLLQSGFDFGPAVSEYVDSNNRARNLSIINILGHSGTAKSKSILSSLRSKLGGSYSAVNKLLLRSLSS